MPIPPDGVAVSVRLPPLHNAVVDALRLTDGSATTLTVVVEVLPVPQLLYISVAVTVNT